HTADSQKQAGYASTRTKLAGCLAAPIRVARRRLLEGALQLIAELPTPVGQALANYYGRVKDGFVTTSQYHGVF
ncbi:hypothetical protein, partial [Ralstonia solanacearum]|uniref:hypothetical protein n=1 Tax=Ralstonia solanacearum TaxID=305 RepID=UPI000A9C7E97